MLFVLDESRRERIEREAHLFARIHYRSGHIAGRYCGLGGGRRRYQGVPPDGLPKMPPAGTFSFRGASRAWWPVPLPPLANSAWNTLFGRPSAPYMETCGGNDKIGSAQLGTDLFKLRKLADIYDMSYTVYMHSAATVPGTDPNHREYGDSRAIGLEFAVDKGNNLTAPNWRCYYYLPRPLAPNEYNTWVTFYPLTEGSWLSGTQLSNPPAASDAKTWYTVGITWDTALFYGRDLGPSYVLGTGETRSYADVKTVSGKTFNFMAGCRMNNLLGNPDYWKSWYNESGYIGSLTIQFWGDAEPTTYDFASLLPVGLTNNAARDPVAGLASSGCKFTVWGKVVVAAELGYVIDDGSNPGGIQVDDPDYWTFISSDDYVSATGYLDNSTDPPTLKYADSVLIPSP
jgi:hypothetical protein